MVLLPRDAMNSRVYCADGIFLISHCINEGQRKIYILEGNSNIRNSLEICE